MLGRSQSHFAHPHPAAACGVAVGLARSPQQVACPPLPEQHACSAAGRQHVFAGATVGVRAAVRAAGLGAGAQPHRPTAGVVPTAVATASSTQANDRTRRTLGMVASYTGRRGPVNRVRERWTSYIW